MTETKEFDRIGLLAGWGRFPIIVAQRLRESGHRVYCCGIKDHAHPSLAKICDGYTEVGVGRMRTQTRFFQSHGVNKATMAGKIDKKKLIFGKFSWIKNFPDLTFWRFFWPNFFSSRVDRSDDSMLLAAIKAYKAFGIHFAPATEFAPELLVKSGVLTKRRLTKYQASDIEFAWNIAKQIGKLDIGQSVAVKGQAILAVEAVEGTDQCIRRAGQLCSSGGFTVVKVAKPQQDMRFDVPTIGTGTIQTLRDAGGAVLAIEADKTIVLDQPEVVDLADRLGVTVVAIDSRQFVKAAA